METTKEVKRTAIWPWLLIFIIVVLGALSVFLYFQLFPPAHTQTFSLNKSEIHEINAESVRLILQSVGFSNLHKNPLTGSKPVMCMIIDSKSYRAVVDNGLTVTEENCVSPDLSIVSSSQEMLAAAASPSTSQYLKTSLSEGKSQIILGASETTLAAKGYLSLYNSLK
jgi:hypothetical protein